MLALTATTAYKTPVSGVFGGRYCVSPETIQNFFALGFGFALAAMLATGYQLLTERPASFRLLISEERVRAMAAVPFLVLAAPFIIMRNTVRGRRIENRRLEFVTLATVLAGFWALMSGSVVLTLLRMFGVA